MMFNIMMGNKQLIIDSEFPDEQKVGGLLLCVAQELRLAMERKVAPTGLTMLQLNVLHTLSNSPEPQLSIGQLTSRLVEENPNISRTLNRLVELKYVVKKRRKTDQRSVDVAITAAGENAHREADAALLGHSLNLSKPELKQLYKLLVKI